MLETIEDWLIGIGIDRVNEGWEAINKVPAFWEWINELATYITDLVTNIGNKYGGWVALGAILLIPLGVKFIVWVLKQFS